MQVVNLHVILDRSELNSVPECSESITLKINILSLFYPEVHDPLEVLYDHILLQARYGGLLQIFDVSLLSELLNQLLFMGILLPGLHDRMHAIEVDYGARLALSLILVVGSEHFMQKTLLSQYQYLVVVDLEHFALERKGAHRGEGSADDVQAKGASSYAICFRFVPDKFKLLKAHSHNVILIFIDLQICLLHDVISQTDSIKLVEL